MMQSRLTRIQKAGMEQDGCAIAVNGVSKKFRIPTEKKLTIFDNLIGLFRGGSYAYEDFLALQDVSFSVFQGETFGVIGPNGCGKSTLLKVLAGAPFLELGVGFQEELTARDNVYLYGAIMGLTKKDIDKRYDEIMDFAELKRFENMKLINFSSGMYVRLAFSTAIQTDPDVILVDEVLSVGDEAFQQKCSQKIDQIRSSGKTILLVSHDLEMVENLCERCILMNGGKIVFLGDTKSALDEYKRMRGR
ncbi:MAG: ABC transporter ATP-binding protein [Methanothrix sp.]|nr:ABC transporter ATP-binding protein [Methanothrix sp.]